MTNVPVPFEPFHDPSQLRWVYRRLIYPMLRGGFALAGIMNQKIARGLKMRRRDDTGLAPWEHVTPNSRPLWFHCASGEFEYAKPVIRAIKTRWPEQSIAVTFFSPTAEAPVRAFPGVDFSCPSPWDEPHALRSFIERARPRALLIARTDVWPEMAAQARSLKVPSLLFSATLSENSARASSWAKPLASLSFGPLNQIHCVSEDDRQGFARLGFASKTLVRGDARFDQALHRLTRPKPIRTELFTAGPPIIVAGSTWREDEAPLLEAYQELRGIARLCVVPHEPTENHIAELEAVARAQGLASVRYSSALAWPEGAILIVDQVGILAELYAHASVALVGGSYRGSVHSVMEPLAAGARTIVGPHHRNNREAIEFQTVMITGLPAVISCPDVRSLQTAIQSALEAANVQTGNAIRLQIAARGGKAVEAALDWIANTRTE